MSLTHFFETLFYRPKWYHWIVSALLSPLSLFYGGGMWMRRKMATRKGYDIPIISVGNLLIGGSGKTPFVIALATHLSDKKVCVVSRGYGRYSRGLVEVSRDGEVLCDVWQSGDEPMLMALSLPQASMIVSEDREAGIELAIRQKAEVIILDDGFNRVEISKYEILLEPANVPNTLPLPSGPFREPRCSSKYADLNLKESIDFSRAVSYENLTEKMVLVTAIANAQRLDRYLPDGVVGKVYLDDHSYFVESNLRDILLRYDAESILTTEKDWVKMSGFKLHISLMKLKLQIKNEVTTKIDKYLKDKNG